MRRISAIPDEGERSDAFSEFAMTMEAMLRFGSCLAESSAESPRKVVAFRRGRGRPKKVDDDAMRAAVFKLMDTHGDFDPRKPKWNVEARLVEAIEDELDLSHSRAKERIREPLEEWRLQR